MSSTVQSGILATERWLDNKEHAKSVCGSIANAFENSGDATIELDLIGTGNGKVELGSGSKQFFSSQLFKIKEGPNKTIYSQIKVFAGKNQRGKPLKTAVIFGKFDGVSITGTASGWSPSNAFYAGGHVPTANGGMHIKGKSTFSRNLEVQNYAYIFEEDVWVAGNFYGKSESVTSEFKKEVYIGGNFKVQNNNMGKLFKDKLGVGGNIQFDGGDLTLKVPKDLWINGKVEYVVGINDIPSGNEDGKIGNFNSLEGTGGDTIHYKNSTGGLDPLLFTKLNEKTSKTYISGFPYKDGRPNGTPNIPEAMGLEASINARKDAPLPAEFVNEMEKYAVHYDTVCPTGCSGPILDRYYNDVDSGRKAGQQLYNEHLVIKCPQNTWFNKPNGSSTFGDFTKKVMFILEAGVSNFGSSGFYNSLPGSSTLIYVKKGASLDFNCSGNFNGLIYVDSSNTSPQSLKFAQGKKITGAIHLQGSGDLTWNSGTGSNPVEIQFAPEVLSGIVGTVGKKVTFDATNTDSTIVFKPMGYYYYNIK